MRLKWAYAVLAATPITLLAFRNGSPVKRTGTIDGGLDCSQCHSNFGPANSDPRGSVRIENLNPYVPGVVQNLRVVVTHPDAAAWGFQLTARFVNGGTQAGSFVPGNADSSGNPDTKVVCDDGSALAPRPLAPLPTPSPGSSTPTRRVPPRPAAAPSISNGCLPQTRTAISCSTRLPLPARATETPAAAFTPLRCRFHFRRRRPAPIRSPCWDGRECRSAQRRNRADGDGGDLRQQVSIGSRTRTVGPGDLGAGVFPAQLSCIAVKIDGKPAPIFYVGEGQINVQAPANTKTGPVPVEVIANPGRGNQVSSDIGTVTMSALAPAFFTLDGKSIAAQFAGKADVVSNPGVVPGGAPAKPGDIVTLYGSGFGATNQPGTQVNSPRPQPASPAALP